VAGCGSSDGDGGGGSGGSKAPIQIGVIGGQTGVYAYIGNDQAQGAKIAAAEINAKGGVDGRKIELIVRDDAGDPTRAANIINDFKSRDVAAIVGSPDNGPVSASLAGRIKTVTTGYIDGGGLLITPKGPGTKPDPWLFGVLIDVINEGRKMSEYIASQDCKRVGVLHDTSSYGRGGALGVEDGLKKSGIPYFDESVKEDYSGTGATNAGPTVQRLRAKGADCVVNWLSPQSSAALRKAAAGAGYDVLLMGPEALPNSPYVKLAGKKLADGTVSATVVGLVKPNAVYKALVEKYAKATGKRDLTVYAVSGYDSVNVLAKAIETAGSAKSEDVRDAMEKIKDFPGAGATIDFTADQHNAILPEDIQIVRYSSASDSWKPVQP
jgi:branched-chain amino acid transport system substrate-binding protein